MRIGYVVLATRRETLNAFLDRKTDIQEYVDRKEAHLSHDLISHGLLLPLTFVAILYQWW